MENSAQKRANVKPDKFATTSKVAVLKERTVVVVNKIYDTLSL